DGDDGRQPRWTLRDQEPSSPACGVSGWVHRGERRRPTSKRFSLARSSLRVGARRAPMHLRYALLALLSEGEAHGYQLLKLFNQRLGPFWHPNIGQVYQLLHELERRGLVARRDQRVGPRLRRIFRLTTRGERALRTWLTRRPAWPPPLRDEIFIRLLAVERDGPNALLDQLA